jgi:hypothetical protein
VTARAWRTVVASRPDLAPPPAAQAPLDPGSLAAEGLSRLRHGSLARGEAILAFAEQRSRRDWRVEDALLDRDLGAGRWDEAIGHADALLRTDSRGLLTPSVFRLMNAAAADPRAREAILDRLDLVHPPWWRESYLRQLGAAVDRGLANDPRRGPPAAGDAIQTDVAEALFLGLAASAAPPTPKEYGPILATLVADGRYAEALALWRRLARRSDAGAPLRDGVFEHDGDDTAFTWRRTSGVGASAEVVETAGGRSLHITYDGFGEPTLPGQLMVLKPGGYRLAWRERLTGPARLAWRVRCADGGQTLADESALPSAGAVWSDRSLRLQVPATGCLAQWLELVARPDERRTEIEAWYAQIGLSPQGAGA